MWVMKVMVVEVIWHSGKSRAVGEMESGGREGRGVVMAVVVGEAEWLC